MSDKWVCIDDESEAALGPYLTALNSGPTGIQIERASIQDIGPLIDGLKQYNALGFLIDLRLDEVASQSGTKAAFRGLTLAQELRTRMTEGEIQSLPLVLWSVDRKLRSSWDGDNTGHDLFDRVYVKDKDVGHNPMLVANELSSLSTGYANLRRRVGVGYSHFWKTLGIEEDEASGLDPRISEDLAGRERHFAHEWARFIMGQLIDRPGPLISEDLLAARLGIDRSKSLAWPKLQQRITVECGYDGVFADGWKRWWSHRLDAWWRALPFSPGPLRKITATDRVAFLCNNLNDNGLTAAPPILSGYSEHYWVICKGLDMPLDVSDGVVAVLPDLKAWQDRPYLSFKAALDRTGRPKWRPHPFEEARLRAAAQAIEE